MRRLSIAAGASLVLHAVLFGVLQAVGNEKTPEFSTATVFSVSLTQLPAAGGMPGKVPAVAPASAARQRPAARQSTAISDATRQPAPAAEGGSASTAPAVSANGAGEEANVASSGHGTAIQLATPLYRLNPPPPYPQVARLRRYEGVVLLRVMVLADGTVGDLHLEKTSGHVVFDETALKAVRGWAFAPGRRGGAPVAMEVQVPVRFALQ